MIIETRNLILPLHRPPKLHRDALLMSFENQWRIQRVFKEIIGLYDIDHFSLNVVDPNGEMSFFSFNPSILYNTFKEGTYLYNGSISPTYYEKLDFYTWEQCYDKRFHTTIKNSLQTKNSIVTGTCLIYRQHGFHILVTCASKNKKNELVENILENKNLFYKMGFHCFELLKDIYSIYYSNNHLDQISKMRLSNFIKSIPHLRIIKNKENVV